MTRDNGGPVTKLDPRKCKCTTGNCHLCREDAAWKKIKTSNLDPKWEKKAKTIFKRLPNDGHPWSDFLRDSRVENKIIRIIAQALQSVADEVMEECAKVAETYYPGNTLQQKGIAEAIRSPKETKTERKGK